ncbi:MAG: DUF6382 domain-containing protein, partial [Clostridiales bacterium]|nr:DUF6382 domain-containing protein [Clostridiales bacterium]
MKPDFAVETNGASVFLASSFSIKDIDKTALGVLRANRDIKGLAPCIAILRDDEMIVKYDITSRKTATEMLRSGANKKMVSSLLLAMAQAQRATEEYPIETCNFILSLDRIYMNPIDFSAVLICVPVDIGGVSAQDMNRLCKLVVSEASYVAGEAIDYVKQIVNLLNSPDFTYQRLQSEMESLLASADSPSPRPTQPRPKPRVQEVPPQPESLQSQDYAPQAYAPQGPARPYPTPARQQKSAPAP